MVIRRALEEGAKERPWARKEQPTYRGHDDDGRCDAIDVGVGAGAGGNTQRCLSPWRARVVLWRGTRRYVRDALGVNEPENIGSQVAFRYRTHSKLIHNHHFPDEDDILAALRPFYLLLPCRIPFPILNRSRDEEIEASNLRWKKSFPCSMGHLPARYRFGSKTKHCCLCIYTVRSISRCRQILQTTIDAL